MSGIPRIYSDANPITEMARFARGIHDASRLRDIQFMEQILRASANGEIDLFTSTISVAECVAAGDDWGKEVQEFFVGCLTSGRMFKLVQDSIFVAERARDLRWKDNIRLKGADAIHVASALEAKCTEFLTFDSDMGKPKVAEKINLLATLGVGVITPSQTLLFPPVYRAPQTHLPLTPTKTN